jgi:UDP-glucose:(heptosyl)LPS alpha-1,3-glucosyltransferase
MITLIKSALHKTGGLEKYTWALARDFCALKVPVTLLTTGIPTSSFVHPLLQIVSFPIAQPLSFLQLLAFDKACQDYLKVNPTPIVFSLDRTRQQTHIRAGNGVHAQYLSIRRQCEGALKRLSFTLNPLHRLLCAIEKHAFEDPGLKRLFTNSHLVKNDILKRFAIEPEKVHVIHNGVEWQEMQADFNAWEERRLLHMQRWKLNPSAHQFLFIGHHYQRKGLDAFLCALSRIKDETFELSVVGKDKNISFYQQRAKALGLEKKVFFFGPVPETIPFYQLADTLVIPSLYDPFANVTVEALAMGLFVISSKMNGGCEILTPEQGRVIEALDDSDSFAIALKEALARPKTCAQAQAIRSGVASLDFSRQLRLMTQEVITLTSPSASLLSKRGS